MQNSRLSRYRDGQRPRDALPRIYSQNNSHLLDSGLGLSCASLYRRPLFFSSSPFIARALYCVFFGFHFMCATRVYIKTTLKLQLLYYTRIYIYSVQVSKWRCAAVASGGGNCARIQRNFSSFRKLFRSDAGRDTLRCSLMKINALVYTWVALYI